MPTEKRNPILILIDLARSSLQNITPRWGTPVYIDNIIVPEILMINVEISNISSFLPSFTYRPAQSDFLTPRFIFGHQPFNEHASWFYLLAK